MIKNPANQEGITELPLRGWLRAVIFGSQDAIYASDTYGRIVSMNPAAERLLGYEARETVGQPVEVLVPEGWRRNERAVMRMLFRGEPVQRYRTERLHKDGSTVPVSVVASPVTNERGVIVGTSVIANDISEQLQVEAAAKQVNELRDNFIAVASHELRTPLTSIAGFATTLMDRWDDLPDGEKRQFLKLIDQQAQRLVRFTDNLLTVSRIEAGALREQSQAVELHGVIEEAVNEIFSAGSTVNISCPGDLHAFADPDHVKQILLNFLSNAIRYGSPPISIEAHPVNRWVEVTICDSGDGVPDEFLPFLFEKFSQGSTTFAKGGTGLGLSIARGLATYYGGEAWYEANRPHGACFAVRLPRAQMP